MFTVSAISSMHIEAASSSYSIPEARNTCESQLRRYQNLLSEHRTSTSGSVVYSIIRDDKNEDVGGSIQAESICQRCLEDILQGYYVRKGRHEGDGKRVEGCQAKGQRAKVLLKMEMVQRGLRLGPCDSVIF